MIGSFLGGFAFAFPVTAVIENQDIVVEFMEDLDGLQAVGDVSCIAVTKKDHSFGFGVRDVPSRDIDIVVGFEPDLLKFKPQHVRGHEPFGGGKINKGVLKKI